ncbi:hypothetical protein D7V91_05345 [bacterium 1xD42-67]|nr:hypothetical protein D7V91_05345 [bacterium 1xD42-67]
MAGCGRAAAFPALFFVFAPLGFSLGDGMIFPLLQNSSPGMKNELAAEVDRLARDYAEQFYQEVAAYRELAGQ